MGRSVLYWVCVFALVALAMGCSDQSTRAGGTGGNGGTGAVAGAGGAGTDNRWGCTTSPCEFSWNGVAMTFAATMVPPTGWEGRAVVTETGELVAAIGVAIVAEASAELGLMMEVERRGALVQMSDVALTSYTSTLPDLDQDGIPEEITEENILFWTAAAVMDPILGDGVVTLSAVPKSNENGKKCCEERKSQGLMDGCTGPCDDDTDLEQRIWACCWLHDDCYCNGGHERNTWNHPQEVVQGVHMVGESRRHFRLTDFRIVPPTATGARQLPPYNPPAGSDARRDYDAAFSPNGRIGTSTSPELGTEAAREDCDQAFFDCMIAVGAAKANAINKVGWVRGFGESGFNNWRDEDRASCECTAAQAEENPEECPPVITSVTPDSFMPGQENIRLEGSNFPSDIGSGNVRILLVGDGYRDNMGRVTGAELDADDKVTALITRASRTAKVGAWDYVVEVGPVDSGIESNVLPVTVFVDCIDYDGGKLCRIPQSGPNGNFVCGGIEMTCAEVPVTDPPEEACLLFHPGASVTSTFNGSRQVAYCDGQQDLPCEGNVNTCHHCPACDLNYGCNKSPRTDIHELFALCR